MGHRNSREVVREYKTRLESAEISVTGHRTILGDYVTLIHVTNFGEKSQFFGKQIVPGVNDPRIQLSGIEDVIYTITTN